MSGGAFNYVSSRPVDDGASDLEGAASLLREDGFADAADRVAEAVAALRKAKAIRQELADVLFVDRIPSGDDSPGDERAAVEAWRARGVPW